MHHTHPAAQSETPVSAALQDHPEYRGLMAAVKAAPADDLPRLVLADWIEEHGDPAWAEFVRVQCEFERNPYRDRIRADTYTDDEGVRPECERGLTLLRRAREVWPRVTAGDGLADRPYHRVAPRGRFVIQPDTTPSELRVVWQCEFRRGFVDQVTCRLAVWLGSTERVVSGPLLVRRQPVTRVELIDRDCADWQARWDALPGVEEVVFDRVSVNLLPWSIASRLKGGTGGRMPAPPGPQRHTWSYPSVEDADDALSAAAIAWAEAQADSTHG